MNSPTLLIDADFFLYRAAQAAEEELEFDFETTFVVGDFNKGKAGFFHFPDHSQPRDLSKEFQCERCSRGFTTLFSYRMHFHRHDMQTPDYDRAFICIRCMEFEAPSSEMITKHGKEDCPVKRHDDTGSK